MRKPLHPAEIIPAWILYPVDNHLFITKIPCRYCTGLFPGFMAINCKVLVDYYQKTCKLLSADTMKYQAIFDI